MSKMTPLSWGICWWEEVLRLSTKGANRLGADAIAEKNRRLSIKGSPCISGVDAVLSKYDGVGTVLSWVPRDRGMSSDALTAGVRVR